MPTLERNLERRCGAFAKERGCLWLKMGTAGWPDRLLILPPGIHVWIELKTGTRVTPLQQKRIDTLHSHGAIAYVVSTFEQFRTHVDAIQGRFPPRAK
jgi:hypothetical protein